MKRFDSITFSTFIEQILHFGPETAKMRVLELIKQTDKPHYTKHWTGDVLKIEAPDRMLCPEACGQKLAVITDARQSVCRRCGMIIRKGNESLS
ncbi:hypothetical protein [Burkholderia glumae]|uniref:hypothetical protein n=1 Tax=Burkholderia glumae TaxID=337 RepID=UPI003B9A1E92